MSSEPVVDLATQDTAEVTRMAEVETWPPEMHYFLATLSFRVTEDQIAGAPVIFDADSLRSVVRVRCVKCGARPPVTAACPT